MINSHFGEFLYHDPMGIRTCRIPYMKARTSHTPVITPFLPTGFSRVPARKTGQLGPSQHDPTKPHHVKYSHEEGPGHISQGLTKFD